MTINNIEYDLDKLLQKHGPNVAGAARELRIATGVTLKDAMNIIQTYQKDGIVPKSGSPETNESTDLIFPYVILYIFLGFLCYLVMTMDEKTHGTLSVIADIIEMLEAILS